MTLFAGGLSIIVLAALLAPYTPLLINRISNLEVYNVKVQFATSPPERQLVPSVERDLVRRDTLDGFPQGYRFIQYDCGQEALQRGGMDKFMNPRGRYWIYYRSRYGIYRSRYAIYQRAIAFRHALEPYINSVVDVQRKYDSIAILKTQVRSVAQKFERLLSTPQTSGAFDKEYEEAWNEVERQKEEFHKNYDANNVVQPEEAQRRRSSVDPDPKWCDADDSTREHLGPSDLRDVIAGTPYMHFFVLALYSSIDDTEGNVRASIMAKRAFSPDINVNSDLAAACAAGAPPSTRGAPGCGIL